MPRLFGVLTTSGPESQQFLSRQVARKEMHFINFAEVTICTTKMHVQPAKKLVVSDSLGVVDFVIGLVNSVFNLPDGQVMFFEEFEKTEEL